MGISSSAIGRDGQLLLNIDIDVDVRAEYFPFVRELLIHFEFWINNLL